MTSHEKPQAQGNLPLAEFVILMALLMSLVALSIDAILPAMGQLGGALGHTDPQSLQQIITFVFGGLAIGQLLYGPLSDQIGRKPAIFLGLLVFILGSLMSWAAESFTMMLAGRFLQGFGVAGPRIVMVALIRDLYEGRAMARIMSIIMGVFIFVPTIAPVLGQGILIVAGWRAIFFALIILGVIGGVWLAMRQAETLAPDRRIKLTFASYVEGTRMVFGTRTCLGYMIAAGIVSGPFIAYLSTAQDLFQNTYQLGDKFPFYFAALALSIGLASFLNSRLVMRFGMRPLMKTALICMAVLSALVIGVTASDGFQPPLWLLMMLFSPIFFTIGILFGNMNALAMEDVGQIAGMASAWIGAVSTLLAMGLAMVMGQFYDGTIAVWAIGFMVASLSAFWLMAIIEKPRRAVAQS